LFPALADLRAVLLDTPARADRLGDGFIRPQLVRPVLFRVEHEPHASPGPRDACDDGGVMRDVVPVRIEPVDVAGLGQKLDEVVREFLPRRRSQVIDAVLVIRRLEAVALKDRPAHRRSAFPRLRGGKRRADDDAIERSAFQPWET